MMTINRERENTVDLVATDFHGTLYSTIHPEIFLGKYSIEERIRKGELEKSIQSFFNHGLKGYLKFWDRNGSTRLLENLGCILEGQDIEIVEDFKKNYDSSKVFNQFLNSLRGMDKRKEYYPGAMNMFSGAPEEMETMVYSQSLEELVNFHLSKDDYIDCFTEGVVGNRLEVSEDGNISGIDWKVDGPDVPLEEQKMELLDLISSKGYEPEETAYIDNRNVGVLEKLNEKGGEGILAPAADQEVKGWGRQNGIYTPESWNDIGEYLGV